MGSMIRCLVAALAVLWLAAPVSLAAQLKADLREDRVALPAGEAVYPVVRLGDAEAARRINDVLKKEVDAFCLQVKQDARAGRGAEGKLGYRVTCNKAGTFSCILEEERKTRKGGSPVIRQKAYVFKLSSGQRATYHDVWAVAAAAGKRKLYDRNGLVENLYSQTRRAGIAMPEEFKGIAYPPANFYLDGKLRFHMLLQPGEVTDAATGVLDIDLDEENW